MAKQSFSVGQVLTAAQMNSLQQTAMLGGSATAKTASYTLVAADAGTVVSVNSTSATTITVNTALFSAGDTVTIQNWGSGAVTITAGTATVNTAGSLIVPQYDGGVLYFTSASAAIYFDFVQAGAVSPLTTKGDLYGFGTSDARIPIGTNGHILTADSAETLGLKWAAPAGATGLTLVKSQTVGSGVSSVTVSDAFSSTYGNYLITTSGITASQNQNSSLQFGTTTTGYYWHGTYGSFSSSSVSGGNGNNSSGFASVLTHTTTSSNMLFHAHAPYLSTVTVVNWRGSQVTTDGISFQYQGFLNNTTSYTAFKLTPGDGTLTGGTISVYGYNL